MHINGMTTRQIIAQLADGFKKRQAFNVANGAADFHKHEIIAVIALKNETLDGIGDMGNDLNSAAEIIAATLFRDDVLIDAASGDIVGFAGRASRKTLIMAEIQIGFRAVIGHKNLTMLVRTHRARINIEIRIKLPQPDCVTTSLKKSTKSR